MAIDPVVPLVPIEGGGANRFRVKPQTRFDQLLRLSPALLTRYVEPPIVANRRAASCDTFTTVDWRPNLIVDELVYPGDAASLAKPFDKWIYLVRADSPVILAEAACGGPPLKGWMWRDFPSPDVEPAWSDKFPNFTADLDRGFALTCLKPCEDPAIIRCYLSPHRLDRAGMKLLLQAQTGKFPGMIAADALVQPNWTNPAAGYVALVDPLDWPVRANQKYYTPLLARYQNYAMSDETASRLAIAGILNAWMSDGDPLKLDPYTHPGTLAKHPAQYLSEFETMELAIRRPADEACAYVCSCIDSFEHYIAEQSMCDRAELERDACRSFALQHWACVFQELARLEAGKGLLDQMIANPVRAPNRFIFNKVSPLDAGFFEAHRWAGMAAMVIVTEMSARWIARMLAAGVIEEVRLREVEALFERLNLKVTRAVRLRVYESVFSLHPNNIPSKYQQRIVKFVVDKTLSKLPASSAADIGATKDAVAPAIADLVYKLRMPLQAYVEYLNLCSAWAGIKGSSFARPYMSLVGAGADATALILDSSAAFLEWGELLSEAAGAVVKKSVLVLSIVSGALDCIENASRASDSVSIRDYGQAVGQGLAAVGAALVVVGGVIVLFDIGVGALAGSPFGPPGVVIGAVGGLLLGAGTLLAAYLKLNAYEQFARNCFLGFNAQATPICLNWMTNALPSPDPVKELETLQFLISNYRVTATGEGNPAMGPSTGQPYNYVEIWPGDTNPHAVLDVEFEITYLNNEIYKVRYLFTFNERQWVKQSGNMDLNTDAIDLELRSKDDMDLRKISIPIQPKYLSSADGRKIDYSQYKRGAYAQSCQVTTRLYSHGRGGAGNYPTPINGRLVCNVMDSSQRNVSSIDDNFIQ